MRKTIYLLIGLAFFTSCFVHKNTISNGQARRNNESIQKANSETIATYTPLTSAQYIERYKGIAMQEMNLYGIPASITLGQGLFESGSGNSELARVANNHFGIKCTPAWTGKSYFKDDDNKNDCFRVYDNAEDSFRDHSLFLKKKNYTKLFTLDITDYKGWAQGLKDAGYATNPNYPSILIGIIQRYNLNQYDRPLAGTETRDTLLTKADQNRVTTVKDSTIKASENSVTAVKDSTIKASENNVTAVKDSTIKISQNIVTAVKDSTIKAGPTPKTYTVKQGDTLFNISKRFGLTVDDLKSLNNLADNNIKIGQILVVVKP